MLLPGPEAQQLATYIGWLLHGTRGGLVAGTLFVLPGFLAIMALSIAYVLWQQHPLMEGLFLGLKAAVIAPRGRGAAAHRKARAHELAPRCGWRCSHSLRSPSFACPSRSSCSGRDCGGICVRDSGWGSYAAPRASRESATAASTPVIDAGQLTQAKPSARAQRQTTRAVAAAVVRSRACCARGCWGRHSTYHPARRVLQQDGRGHFRWRLRRAHLRRAAGGGAIRLGHARADARRAGPRRIHARTVDHGGAVRGLSRRLPGCGQRTSAAGGSGRRLLTVWVTFVPCFLWIFLGAPYIEALRGNAALAQRARGHHRRRGRRDRQSRVVVRLARAVRAGSARTACPTGRRCARCRPH